MLSASMRWKIQRCMAKGKAEANLPTCHSSQTESKHAQKVGGGKNNPKFHTFAAVTSVSSESEKGGSDCTCPTLV